MTLSPPPSHAHGASDAAPPSLAIHALANTQPPPPLAKWLDAYISSTTTAATTTTTAASKLEETHTNLRQLSLSLSTTRNVSLTELDHHLASLTTTIPTLTLQLQLMCETATNLHSHIQSLHTHTGRRDACADAVLARIAVLCAAKVRLMDARHALREAQAWSTLEAHVTVLVGEKRWKEAVDRVEKATESLRLFSGSTKSNRERSALLERLTKGIQEQLVCVVKKAIDDGDRDEVRRLARLFAQTQNGVDVFFAVYTNTRAQPLLERWSRRAEEMGDMSLSDELTWLYQGLISVLAEERVACCALFSDPNQATQLLAAYILTSLDPPIHECIQRATRAHVLESFLTTLTDAFLATEETIRAVESKLPPPRPQRQNADDCVDAASTWSIDTNALSVSPTDRSWKRQLLEPFVGYQTRLATLEAEAMQFRLTTLRHSGSTAMRSVKTAFENALHVVNAALRRSAMLTKSFATASLVPLMDGVFQDAMECARVEVETELQGVLEGVERRIRRMNLCGGGGGGNAAMTYDESGDVLTVADWDEFRSASEKLGVCRDAVAAVSKLEQTIAYQMSEVSTLIKPATGEASDANRVVDYTSVVCALATSELNSTGLHDLVGKAKRMVSMVSWNVDGMHQVLLPRARSSVVAIAEVVHTFQHDLVLSQFLPEMEIYPKLSIWTSDRHPSIVNEYDLAMPRFSLSPTEAMARVGEAMLNLPRLFEGYADDVLLFGLETVHPDLRTNTAVKSQRTGTGSWTDVGGERSSMHRQAFSTTVIPTAQSDATTAVATVAVGGGEEGENEGDVHSLYLHSLLTLFLTRFLGQVVPSLPRLSEIGAAQLAADLDYLSNISSVIYSESELVLRHWKKAAEISSDEGRLLVAEYMEGGKSGLEGEGEGEGEGKILVESEAFSTIARLRGWK